jgi:hypothetical protein
MEVSRQLHACHFTVEKGPQYSLNVSVGGPQRWSGCFGEEINLLPLPELEPKIMQPIA